MKLFPACFLFVGISSPEQAVFIPRVDSPLSELWVVPDTALGEPLKTVKVEARRSSTALFVFTCYSPQ